MTPTRAVGFNAVLKAGASYFAVVFAAGFLLGVVRVLWALPRYGERTAELMEAPVMLAVIVAAAWWITRGAAFSLMQRLGTGVVALGLLVAAESWFVLLLEELTLAQYLASRDVVAGLVYMTLLGTFAAMPALMPRRHVAGLPTRVMNRRELARPP